jgi:hypothetical protein
MVKMCEEVEGPVAKNEAERFEWADVYRSGKCADFTVVAGERTLAVHRVL